MHSIPVKIAEFTITPEYVELYLHSTYISACWLSDVLQINESIEIWFR